MEVGIVWSQYLLDNKLKRTLFKIEAYSLGGFFVLFPGDAPKYPVSQSIYSPWLS